MIQPTLSRFPYFTLLISVPPFGSMTIYKYWFVISNKNPDTDKNVDSFDPLLSQSGHIFVVMVDIDCQPDRMQDHLGDRHPVKPMRMNLD